MISEKCANSSLIVDPKYLECIPRPTKNRYDEIKKDISEHGQQIDIIVNQDNVILDGHTRYQITQELGITPKSEKREFVNKLEEERFVYSVNIKRRDLSDFTHIELSLKIHELDAKIGEQKRNTTLKQNNSTVFQNSEKRNDVTNTTKTIANETKTSADTVSRVKKITQHATQKELQDLREGKDGASINKTYKKIKKQEKKEKRQEEIKKIQVKLSEKIQLYNMAFQVAPVTAGSVSLIFSDPPYHTKYLYLFEDLAKHASKVLREGGSLITYVGHANVGKVISMMESQGLNYHWIISVDHSGPSASVFGKGVLVGWKPLLWFTKGKYSPMEFVKDKIKSEFQGKLLHDWAQSTVESDYFIKYLTIENEIVYDPFLGQGTFGVSAARLGRQFIGCEIDPEHFANAERLISSAAGGSQLVSE